MVRFKNRWLLLSLDTRPSSSQNAVSTASKYAALPAHPNLTPQLVTKLLRNSLSTNFGDVASGAYGGSLVCKYYSSHTGTAIVRCAREGAKIVWAAASLITSTDPGSSRGHTLRIQITHLGGTIKKLQKKSIEGDKKRILALRLQQNKNMDTAASAQKDNTAKMIEASRKAISAIS